MMIQVNQWDISDLRATRYVRPTQEVNEGTMKDRRKGNLAKQR